MSVEVGQHPPPFPSKAHMALNRSSAGRDMLTLDKAENSFTDHVLRLTSERRDVE